MSAATDAGLVALGERFEKLLLEYLGSWLNWAPRMRLGRFRVDHQLELDRRLHRKIGRLLALEDAVDVGGRAPVLVDSIRPIGDQAAGRNEEAVRVDRGQFVPGRQGDDQIAMKYRPVAPGQNQTSIGGSREGGDGALDLDGVAQLTGVTSTPSGGTAWIAAK
jgi:hypothetical protein